MSHFSGLCYPKPEVGREEGVSAQTKGLLEQGQRVQKQVWPLVRLGGGSVDIGPIESSQAFKDLG